LRSWLVPVVDDAGLHQIGDPVADRPRMDAETLLAAERVGHRLGNRAEAKLIVAWSGIRRSGINKFRAWPLTGLFSGLGRRVAQASRRDRSR
jgi:hypothetical protein